MDNLKSVEHLCAMIVYGVKNNDVDCTRSHAEDLNNFLVEKNLIGE